MLGGVDAGEVPRDTEVAVGDGVTLTTIVRRGILVDLVGVMAMSGK